MSTKTSIKRIAAVAAVALTLGGFSAVTAHASAGANITALTAGTSAPARVGVISGTTIITPTFVTSSFSGTDTVTAQVVSAPSTSVSASLSIAATSTSTTTAAISSALDSSKTDQLSPVASGLYPGIASATLTYTDSAHKNFRVSLNADVAGSYQILVTANPTSLAGYSTGAVSTTYTITTAGAPTSVTLVSAGGSATTNDTVNGSGQLFKMTLKDANGAATVLGLNEAIKMTISDTKNLSLTDNAGTGIVSAFGSASLASGSYYVKVKGGAGITASTTAILTATGSGVLSSSLVTNATVTETLTTAAAAGATWSCTTPLRCSVANGAYTVGGAAALTVTGIGTAAAAGTSYAVLVTDNAGNIYSDVISTTLTTATYTGPSVTSTATSASLSLIGATAGAISFAYLAPTASALTIQGATSVVSATGAKNSFVGLVTDTYGVKMANIAVAASVAGRNTIASYTLGVTDANGLISFSYTDAGTTGTKDTVTLTPAAGTAGTATVTFGTFTVATVTVTGGSTAADAANGATNKTAINTADNGPEASAVAIKAVVKDASGNLLAGVPVTFTVDKGLIKKTASVDYSVVYTGSDGSATTYAFNWLVGKQTITATSGGVSKSDYITWAATDASSARVLSSVVNGTVITYTVADRFGNPVKGVTINQTRTGSGLFGNGSSTQDVVTGTDGTVDATFTGTGSAVGTLAATYAQAYAPAGQYDFTAGDTYTAPVAGTTSGTGASLAPAGVATVAVTTSPTNAATDAAQAAQDAANEATDAANAATDAANNAMDSADAAQQAAMDAGDKADAALAAITDLASKVSEIASQVAALSSIVAKIAAAVAKISKKVKA